MSVRECAAVGARYSPGLSRYHVYWRKMLLGSTTLRSVTPGYNGTG